MKLTIERQTEDFDSYRAARVKSLFNVDRGDAVTIEADIPIEDPDWRIGVVVGPSGSGKSTIGQELAERGWDYVPPESLDWPADKPIIEALDADFDAATGALSAVGLGTVPSWLRPYRVLSTGEKFRADMARIILTAPDRVVVDEFTSVVDRQIARIGALAFGKAWRRTGGQVVLLTPHYDILDWVQPDWVFDTGKGGLQPGSWTRPPIHVDVLKTDWSYWPLFKPHHYLDVGPMPAAQVYVGMVDGEPVAHLGMGSKNISKGRVEARGCRLVVMPEWQGAGVGMKFLNHVCQLSLEGHPDGKFPGRPVTTIFHTSHPGLASALRRDPKWVQVSAKLYGANKKASAASMRRSAAKGRLAMVASGYGGHFRAVQGFRYVGDRPWKQGEK